MSLEVMVLSKVSAVRSTVAMKVLLDRVSVVRPNQQHTPMGIRGAAVVRE
jgi:hypothetical protein